ncbi:MAG: hypothetical protein ACRDK0_13520 [Solirubrobacteraceae bacterium]
MADAGETWEDAIGPLLTERQVRELLGGVCAKRVDQLVEEGCVIVLHDRSGRRRFPGWQFCDGRSLETLAQAHRCLVDAGQMSPWTAAYWCVHAHPELDGRSPRDFAAKGHEAKQLGSSPSARPRVARTEVSCRAAGRGARPRARSGLARKSSHR